MEAASSSETPENFCLTAWCHVPEGGALIFFVVTPEIFAFLHFSEIKQLDGI
jgi:hypothetical protein